MPCNSFLIKISLKKKVCEFHEQCTEFTDPEQEKCA